jgi:hypothetical protein
VATFFQRRGHIRTDLVDIFDYQNCVRFVFAQSALVISGNTIC